MMSPVLELVSKRQGKAVGKSEQCLEIRLVWEDAGPESKHLDFQARVLSRHRSGARRVNSLTKAPRGWIKKCFCVKSSQV